VTLTVDQEEGRRPVVILEVDEDFADVQLMAFEEYLEQARAAGHVCVVVDLTKARWTSLKALKVLLSHAYSFRKKNGDLRLAGINPYLRSLLELTGMTSALESYDTRAVAYQSFHEEKA